MSADAGFEYFQICPVSDLRTGEKIIIEIGNEGIVLVNCEGAFHAVADVCTHDQGPLGEGDLEGCELVCPRHGARFDVRNGFATRLPAVEPTPSYPTRVVNGWVEIGIPEVN